MNNISFKNLDFSQIIELCSWDDIKNKVTTLEYISIKDLFNRYNMSVISSYDELNNYKYKSFVDPLSNNIIEELPLENNSFLILNKDDAIFIAPILDSLLPSINSLLYISEKDKDSIKSVTEDNRGNIIDALRDIKDVDLLSNLEDKIKTIIDTDNSIESIPNGQVGFPIENGVGYIYDVNDNFRISVEFVCISNDLYMINSVDEF